MIEIFQLAALTIPAIPVALVFVGRVQAVFAVPVIVGVTAPLAGMVHVVSNIPITIAWLTLIIAGYVVVGLVPALRRRFWQNLTRPSTLAEYMQLAVVAVIIVLVVPLAPAALLWDARSIWLFHASWLAGPASSFIDAQQLAPVAFSHANYPIMGLGYGHHVGLGGGTENMQLAVQAIALLSILTIAFAGSLALGFVARRGYNALNLIAFFLFLGSGLTVADHVLNRGYVDPLQAGFVLVVIALLLPALFAPLSRSAAALLGLVAVASAAVKQEGFYFTAVVLIVYLVLTFRLQNVAKYLPLVLMVAFYLVWRGFLLFVQADDTSDAAGVTGRLGEVFDPSSLAWAIILRIGGGEGRIVPLFILILVFSLAMILLRKNRETAWITIFVGLSWLGIAGVIALTYALGDTRDNLDFWILTSFSRVTGTLELITWFFVFLAVLIASSAVRPAPQPDSEPLMARRTDE